ncbi:MAG: Spore coat protein A [Chroococcidiopsis cubana SAG 39.79]|jgi:spore coat protein A, manganese oxidase|uniref:Spore coat protein A n=1 Tax=Chroococcidiopsis cubana SAG 39.79 TaxID=388085 RepID=A0AB37UIH5_9CYAN|nr:multicopper oxidase domain-containing protein [Chroococcidiopsis cubana]MDZ4873354.1 Spore coat protein A [Chroococcidiopsis cubana SAG 39.79]PSB44224.1 bilirubin oxidase [Cyanosarcina cf. burmensis CCALA 770]PSB60425.1 bilirubin oxidase [Chroococcidiopsis cubana CCALA 043]RUT11149.1 spore coat protein A [Chroococcidiopsis cubana SAG 39.79]
MNRITRREALKLGGFAAAGSSLLLPIALQHRGYAQTAGSPQPRRFQVKLPLPPVLNPVRSDATTDYYQIEMQKNQVEILPGLTTEIWAYNSITPGPTIKQRRDRQSVVRFINNVGTPTSVHLHGMASLPQYDGYAEDLIPPGYYKNYIYPNNRAATMWYHDHAIHDTARNVYMGLAGMYIVQDDLELGLPLPKGEYDVPLVIQDKLFTNNGSFIFDHDNHQGLMGDVILVNGAPYPRMEVANRKYRFRVLNASNSRSYRLALSTGDDLIVIGTDGGLMSAPVRTKDLRIGMGERYELIVDFSKYSIGTQILLQNLGLPNNKDYDGTRQILRFDVVRQETDNSSIPSQLRSFQPLVASSAVATRRWTFEHRNDRWEINGNGWDKNRVDARIGLGNTEIWEIITNGRDWFHPVHFHLFDFQILERSSQPPLPYERGWKDVVYLGEDNNIRIIARFGPHNGKYMMHCHNTVHEDHDMMTQFEVGSGGADPMSAPAKPLPAPSF